MLSDMYVIDGCAFAEEDFTGVTQKVKDSPLTAFFLTTPGEDQGMLALAHNIGGIYNMADDPASGLMVVRTIAELEQAKAQGKIGVILGFQNPHCIENSLEKLRALYELGIRVVQMTYNKANYIGSGCLETKDSGLTDFGRQALKAMNRLGMVADGSHCGPQTTLDIIRYSEKPVVISHAGAAAVTPNVRNKSDEALKLLKDNGGVIGLSPWGPLCWKPETGKRPTMDDYLDHVDYVVNLIGIDHVGFGGDSTLDDNEDRSGIVEQATLYAPVVEEYNQKVGVDPDVRHAIGVRGSWEINNVIEAMRGRGYSDEDIKKLTGGNFLRVLKANWK